MTMNRFLCLILIVAGMWTSTAAQGLSSNTYAPKKEKYRGNHRYIYRLTLKDKNDTTFSLSRPREFLSAKAIERRQRQNLPVDSTDLPVSRQYVKTLGELGLRVAEIGRAHV